MRCSWANEATEHVPCIPIKYWLLDRQAALPRNKERPMAFNDAPAERIRHGLARKKATRR